jgi:thioredoxin 1
MKQILYFSGAWCGPCKMFKPKMESLKSEGLPIQFIDVDQQPDIAQKYGIRNVPTTVFVNNGVETNRVIGVKSKEEILSLYNR